VINLQDVVIFVAVIGAAVNSYVKIHEFRDSRKRRELENEKLRMENEEKRRELNRGRKGAKRKDDSVARR
jgi:hypothetical protein